jgi:hypothetical protein
VPNDRATLSLSPRESADHWCTVRIGPLRPALHAKTIEELVKGFLRLPGPLLEATAVIGQGLARDRRNRTIALKPCPRVAGAVMVPAGRPTR